MNMLQGTMNLSVLHGIVLIHDDFALLADNASHAVACDILLHPRPVDLLGKNPVSVLNACMTKHVMVNPYHLPAVK